MDERRSAGGSVLVSVHGDLADFLRPGLRGVPFERPVDGRPAVKDMIEATGVPHPEIGEVLVNERPVPLSERVGAGDRVQVLPFPHGAPARRGPATFVLDGHLGRLAAYLRMAGFDTAYDRAAIDRDLAARSAAEDRILLTRDVGLLRRGIVERGAFVRSDRPAEQLAEILERFGLVELVTPFGRCMRCNRRLEEASRGDVAPVVPPRVLREQAEFHRCPGCGGVYWRGSHHRRMEGILAAAVEGARDIGRRQTAAAQRTTSPPGGTDPTPVASASAGATGDGRLDAGAGTRRSTP